MQSTDSFEEWQGALDQALLEGWCINTNDMGLDAEELNRLWREPMSPLDCALYFERRFDLIRRDF